MKKVFWMPESVSHFRRWMRTQFAVFYSIGHRVRIGVLPVIYVLTSFTHSAFAQDEASRSAYHAEIDSVLVEAVKQQALALVPRASVVRLGGAELLRGGSTSVQQSLESLPGVDVRQRGPLGMQADLSIRGGGFDQVLVLMDGLDVTDAQTGHHSLTLPLRPEAMGRLELLSGPGARIYAPGAYSGAINLVPRRADSTHLLLSAKGGQYGLRDIFAGAAHRYNNLSVMGYVAGSSADGYTANTDHILYNGYLSTQVDLRRGVVRVQLAHLAKEFGAQAFYSPKFPDQFEALKTSLATLTYQGYSGRWEWEASGVYRHLTDRFQLFRYNAPAWYKGHNYHQTQLFSARGRVGYNTRFSRTQLALVARYDEIWSTNLGKEAKRSRAIPGVDGARYTHSGERLNLTAALEQTFYFGAWTLNVGGMSSQNSAYGLAYGYGADLSYQIIPSVAATVSANSAYRLPTFTDLYYQSPTRVGNEKLHPEEALTFEGGVKAEREWLRASGSLFYRMGSNIIDWQQESPTSTVWRAQNVKRLNTAGGEVVVSVLPQLSFLKNVSVAYAYCKNLSDKEEGKGASYTYDNLLHLATLRAEVPCTRWVSLLPSVRYAQRDGKYTPYSATPGATPRSYPANVSVDLRVTCHVPSVDLFVEGTNLLDAERVDIGNVPLPGRWLTFGLQYQMGWR